MKELEGNHNFWTPSQITKKVDNRTLLQYAEFSISLSMLGPLLCHSYSVFHPGAILTSELVID